jgi:predicted O-methyltransferase YrrM
MNPHLKNFRARVRGFVPGLFVIGRGLGLLYSRRSYLRQQGYLLSTRLKQPVRRDGSPIPWMNYNAIAFLEQRLHPDMSVFEFGSGNSTRFFAQRVAKVVSVECDRGWYEKLRGELPPNAELLLCEPYAVDAYLGHLRAQPQPFDMIVVDAEDREACLRAAPERLSERGVVVLDDAERPNYQAGVQHLLALGFKKLDFEGLKPGGIRAYRTSVFYRPENVLDI